MTRYDVAILRAPRKQIKNLPLEIREEVIARIRALANDPKPVGSEKMKVRCSYDLYRMRVGDYRILYLIDHDQRLVTIARVAHRREVYRNLAVLLR